MRYELELKIKMIYNNYCLFHTFFPPINVKIWDPCDLMKLFEFTYNGIGTSHKSK